MNLVNRALVAAIWWWIFLAAVYQILAAKNSVAELLIGAGLGVAGAGLMFLVGKNSVHHFHFRASWLGKLARVPGQMLADCLLIFGAILRRLIEARGGGRFQLCAFRSGNEHPAARARRALVFFGMTCAPNAIALGVAPNEQLLVHQLVPKQLPPRGPDWPL